MGDTNFKPMVLVTLVAAFLVTIAAATAFIFSDSSGDTISDTRALDAMDSPYAVHKPDINLAFSDGESGLCGAFLSSCDRWTTDDLRATVSATSALGLDALMISLNGKNEEIGSGAEIDIPDGVTEIRVTATDILGHKSTIKTTRKADTTKPRISVTGLNSNMSAITGVAADADSGVESVTAILHDPDLGRYWNGKGWVDNSKPVQLDISKNGDFSFSTPPVQSINISTNHKLTVTAHDKAGNERTKTMSIRVADYLNGGGF